MPKVGEEEFDYTPEGIAEAEAYAEAAGLPTSNAQERSVTSYVHGGQVQQPQSPVMGRGPGPFPGPGGPIPEPRFNKGGKVKKKGYKG